MIILAVVLSIFVMLSLVMPWIQLSRLAQLNEQVEALKKEVSGLRQWVSAADGKDQLAKTAMPVTAPAVQIPVAEIKPAEAPQSVWEVKTDNVLPPVQESLPEVKPEPQKENGFEWNFGSRLPVWIGGIALIFAGYYLVRYSLEMGLLGPEMRVIMSLLFGFSLIGAAHKVGPYSARSGQSLAGAGLAVLYCSLFAASNLYHLVSSLTTFVGMMGVTGLAVVLALRYGPAIALLGMTGGFLTPLLVGSQTANVPLLLAYLYVLFAVLFWFIRRQKWWSLSLLLLPFTVIWAFFILKTMATSGEGVLVGLFLMAVTATVVRGTRQLEMMAEIGVFNLTVKQVSLYLNYGACLAAALITAMATVQGGFDWTERGLMLALSTGALGLAYFDRPLYAMAPPFMLGVNVILLLGWEYGNPADLYISLAVLMALFSGASAIWLWRSNAPVYWALINVGSYGAFYLTAYLRLHNQIHEVTVLPLISLPFWSAVALLIAGHMVMRARKIYLASWASEAERQNLLAIYASAATAFISVGVGMELSRDYLPIAAALQVAFLAWINSRLEVKALAKLTSLTAGLFAISMIIPVNVMMDISNASSRYYLMRHGYIDQQILAFSPALFFLLPAVALGLAVRWLQMRAVQPLSTYLEIAAASLLALFVYSGMYVYVADNYHLSFLQRNLANNLLLVLALGYYGVALRWSRPILLNVGRVLALLILARIGLAEILFDSPLANSHLNVGSWPLINGVLLAYALPVLWLHYIAKVEPHAQSVTLLKVCQLGLAFVWASFTVRHFYHGADMALPGITQAELYTYSALWLALSGGLLLWGAEIKNRPARAAALVLMLVTVGKVFLVDAANLDGLWRVFSFLGLGLSLIALSWFYNHFIFQRDD